MGPTNQVCFCWNAYPERGNIWWDVPLLGMSHIEFSSNWVMSSFEQWQTFIDVKGREPMFRDNFTVPEWMLSVDRQLQATMLQYAEDVLSPKLVDKLGEDGDTERTRDPDPDPPQTESRDLLPWIAAAVLGLLLLVLFFLRPLARSDSKK